MGLETEEGKPISTWKRLVLCQRSTVSSQDWDVAILAASHVGLEKQRRLVRSKQESQGRPGGHSCSPGDSFSSASGG